ncbi:MAG TPA: DUF4214 domain-containing protein [Pirellulales bacterium]|nr:DUF4214 domain-containing protein [Pirellulales bacterium]
MIANVPAGTTTFADDGNETTTTQAAAHLQPPASVTATAATGGTLAANTTYYYLVTAVNALGETTGGTEAVGTTTSTKLTQDLSWAAVNGALGYRVYRGTASGAENVLIGVVNSGTTTTFIDDGTEAATPVVSLRNALLLDGGTGTAPNLGDLVRFNPAKDFNTSAFGTPAINFVGWDQTSALNPNTNSVVSLAHGNLVDLDSSDGNGLGTGGSTPFSQYSVNSQGVATVTVNAVNDAPTITVPGGPFLGLEGQPFTFSSKNGTNPIVADFDDNEGNGPTRGQVLVTIATDPTQGTLTLGSTAGLASVSGNGTATLTLQGPLATVNQDLDGLSFTPTANFAGAANVTFQADDLGNAGLGGDQTSPQVTVQVSFTAQHQAPLLYPTSDGVAPATGQPHFASVLENTPAQSNTGSLVGDMLSSLNTYDVYHDGRPTANVAPTTYPPFLDLDADAGAKEGIAVTSVSSGNGTWQYSLDGGASWTSISPTSLSTASALLLPGASGASAGALVRFLPNQNFTGTVQMTFYAWDQTDGAAAGSHANLSTPGATGGATAYSTGTATATLNVATANQPPSFSLLQNYSTLEDNTVAASGGTPGGSNASTISVPNFAFGINPGLPGETVTFTVTVNAAGQGLFSVAPAIDPSGTLTFTLNPDVFGNATLTVTAKNSGSGNNTSNPQTTSITVTGINDPPTLDPISNQQVAANAGQQTVPLTGITAGLNESQVLTITATSSNPSVVPNPTISYTSANPTGTLFYTPASVGTATITVTVTDNGGTANGGVNTFQRQFSITVGSAVPTANAQSVSVTENTQVSITLGGTLPAGQTGSLSATIATLPATGTLYQTSDGTTRGAPITAANTPVTDPQNRVIYVPNANQTANDSFTFTVSTSGGQTSAPATVSISVALPGQNPSFTVAALAQVSENAGPQTFPHFATNISAGSGGASGATLSFAVTGDTNPSLFSVAPTLDAATGNLSFTPAANQLGSAQITVVLQRSDGVQSAPQTFTVVLDAVPIAVPDVFVLSNSATSSGSGDTNVLANDTTPDGHLLQAVVVNQPLYGTLTLNADGSFSYTPGPAFRGLDRFSYEAENGTTLSSPATVTLISPQANIVDKLYHQVLGRAADDAGLQYWTGQIMQGQQYGIIAQGIFESDERLTPIISRYYQQFLLRNAEPSGVAYWMSIWRRDGGPENVVAGMISSPEFFGEAGNTNSGWVQALYERLLNRPADTQGLQYWTGKLDSGAMTRAQVVLGFELSHENFVNTVAGFYQQYLNRQPTADESAKYVAQLASGVSQAQVQIELINTDEYRNSPPPPAPGTVNRLTSL